MSDTTNLLDARRLLASAFNTLGGTAWRQVAEAAGVAPYREHAAAQDNTERVVDALLERIVRQTREGMVPKKLFDEAHALIEKSQASALAAIDRREESLAENARLRAELATAKRSVVQEMDDKQLAQDRLEHAERKLATAKREAFADGAVWARSYEPMVFSRLTPESIDLESHRRYPAPAVADTVQEPQAAEREAVALMGGCKLLESEDVPNDEVWLYDSNRKRIVLRVAMGGGK